MWIRMIGMSAMALSIAVPTAGAQEHDTAVIHEVRGVSSGSLMARPDSGMVVLVAPSGAKAPRGMAIINGATIELMVAGNEPGSKRAWHAHKGTCAHDEGTYGDAGAYPPLIIGLNGRGSTKVTLSRPLLDGSSYFIAVHTSATSMNSIVACGPVQAGKM